MPSSRMRRAHRLGLLVAGGALGSCRPGTTTLPPLAEVLVIVDTDAPVPRLVSRLRVDVFTKDGTWYDSRDFGLTDPSDWPVSFGAYSPTPGTSNVVLLRLRAYAEGMTRDYRGERYQARPRGGVPSDLVAAPPPPKGEAPRLEDARGRDVTPTSEPQPLVTIDRLVLVRTEANTLGSTRVVLRGDCFGTMADLAARKSCVDEENTLVDVGAAVPLDSDLTVPGSLAGTFGATTPCTASPRGPHTAPDGTPLLDEEACVPGGAFTFGSAVEFGMSVVDGVPERVAIVDPFLMDKYEVTVARWREAVSAGLLPGPPPLVNDGPIPTRTTATGESGTPFCTWSDAPLGREQFPLNCVTWSQAREFCQAEGGDLPLEVEWEYAAVQFGRTFKSPYPWGGNDTTLPTCAEAVFGRGYDTSNGLSTAFACLTEGVGPLAEDRQDMDVAVGTGIEKLGGDVSEWMREELDSLGSSCWMTQPLHMPTCHDPAQPLSSVRGGSWSNPSSLLYYGIRSGYAGPSTFVGFRCVRPGTAARKGARP